MLANQGLPLEGTHKLTECIKVILALKKFTFEHYANITQPNLLCKVTLKGLITSAGSRWEDKSKTNSLIAKYTDSATVTKHSNWVLFICPLNVHARC